MVYSAQKLNKQGDNIQPWCTPFPIWNQSVVPHPVRTIASWPAYRFLKRQVRWSGIPICFRIFHSLLWSTQSKVWHSQESRNRCFSGALLLFPWSSGCWQFDLWFLCLFYNQLEHLEVHCWCIAEAWLREFEHYLTSMWDECNCVAVWAFFGIAFLWDGMKTDLFNPVVTAEFSKSAGIVSATLSQHHLSGFEIAQLEFHHLHYLCS